MKKFSSNLNIYKITQGSHVDDIYMLSEDIAKTCEQKKGYQNQNHQKYQSDQDD